MKKVRTPQRLIAVTKYLTGVMQDQHAPARLRMAAAERICELYLESERNKTARTVAIARAESRAEQAALEKTAHSTPDSVQGESQTDPQAEAERDGLNRVAAFMESFKKSA